MNSGKYWQSWVRISMKQMFPYDRIPIAGVRDAHGKQVSAGDVRQVVKAFQDKCGAGWIFRVDKPLTGSAYIIRIQ
jgi:hypothetical protein